MSKNYSNTAETNKIICNYLPGFFAVGDMVL